MLFQLAAAEGFTISAQPLEGITVCQRKTYNFLRCSVEGNAMNMTAYDADGNSFDSFIIDKKN